MHVCIDCGSFLIEIVVLPKPTQQGPMFEAWGICSECGRRSQRVKHQWSDSARRLAEQQWNFESDSANRCVATEPEYFEIPAFLRRSND